MFIKSHQKVSYFWILFSLTLLAYCLPWIHNPVISLSLNAYDLAEWTSLHPLVRSNTPTLLTSFMLRLALPCLGLAAVFGNTIQNKVIKIALISIITLALLPPLEFFTNANGDSNYRQQFILVVITAIAAIVGLSTLFQKHRHIISATFIGVGLIGTLVGTIQAYNLMVAFALPVQLGIGSLSMMLLLIALIILEINYSHSAITN
ncbi:MAG: hypothetical protein K8L97_02580 [Anaerolineae bacterium]|nr:hypothetical protein [Anaerolineae bacterium]